MSEVSVLMCMALATDSGQPCGGEADYPLTLQDGSSIPLCWQHAQMIKSGWYMAAGDWVGNQVKLRYYRTSKYGI